MVHTSRRITSVEEKNGNENDLGINTIIFAGIIIDKLYVSISYTS
jgi:hypothetical protein